MARYILKDEILDPENMRHRVLDNAEERIDEYRKHSDRIVLYTINVYKSIYELQKDYEKFKSMRRDIKSLNEKLEKISKDNEELNYKLLKYEQD